MPQWAWLLVGAAVVIATIAALILITRSADRRRRHQTQRLKEHFGPEYARAVTDSGGRRAAETELLARERHRKRLEIVSLPPEERTSYANRWRTLQTGFVDDPASAVVDAERLLTEVMQACGYPMDDFDQAAADVSVDHPDVVENFRHAHDTYLSQRKRKVDTEEQRHALVHYRALLERLLGTDISLAVGKGSGESQEARS